MSLPRADDTPWTPDDTPWSPDADGEEARQAATALQQQLDKLWCVILYNDNYHTFDEVILQLQKATGCGQDKASRIAGEVHTRGRAIAYRGEKDRCQKVATILREIRLQVDIDQA